jgi:hypothetical protein
VTGVQTCALPISLGDRQCQIAKPVVCRYSDRDDNWKCSGRVHLFLEKHSALGRPELASEHRLTSTEDLAGIIFPQFMLDFGSWKTHSLGMNPVRKPGRALRLEQTQEQSAFLA